MGDGTLKAAEQRDEALFFDYPRIPFSYSATAPKDRECKACFRLRELFETGASLTIAEAWFGCGLVPAWDNEKHGVHHSHREFSNFVAAYARNANTFGATPFLPKYLWRPCIQQASLRQDYLFVRELIFGNLLAAEEAGTVSSATSLCIRKLLWVFSKKSIVVCSSTMDGVCKLAKNIVRATPIFALPAPVKNEEEEEEEEEEKRVAKKRVKTEPAD